MQILNHPASNLQQTASLSDDPSGQFDAYRIPLNEVKSDAAQILAILEDLKQQYIRVPSIREFTVSKLRGIANNDQLAQVNRVIEFVRNSLTYVRDPIDSEYIITPDRLISQWQRNHYMAGDCDDHTLLLNTMLGTIGIDTKFVGVKFGDVDVFNHVICGIIMGGSLYQVDPCSKLNAQPKYKETLIL